MTKGTRAFRHNLIYISKAVLISIISIISDSLSSVLPENDAQVTHLSSLEALPQPINFFETMSISHPNTVIKKFSHFCFLLR